VRRVALVTGGVTGIGRAIAEALVNDDYSVVICDVDDERGTILEKSFREKGKDVLYRHCNVADEDQVRSAVDYTIGLFQRLDALVNNAGIIRRKKGEDIFVSDWDEVFQVNARGTFLFSKYVSTIMKQQRKGKIVNISSIAGKLGDITSAPGYGPSKSAIDGLTKTFARELAPYSITVNGVAPHAIETEMSAEWSEERRREIIQAIPLQRLGKPSEVAAVVMFLLSEGADFITGEIIDINGGFLMD
jgi:3-oxoacyl-[acyl-carrier protein] reductase